MRVLLISYHYPPARTIGAVRPHAFAGELSARGYEVTVLTAGGPPGVHDVDGVREIRTRAVGTTVVDRLKSWVRRRAGGSTPKTNPQTAMPWWKRSLPDPQAPWLAEAIPVAVIAAVAMRPDVVFVTGRPFSAFVAGMIAARAGGAPLVLDLRDPWSVGFSDNDEISDIARLAERFCFSQASAVVLNTESSREAYQAAYPSGPPLFTIPNAVVRPRLPTKAPPRRPFVLMYGGTLYQRSFDALLRGFQAFVDARGFSPSEARLEFVGDFQPESFDPVLLESLGDFARVSEFLPRSEYEARLATASVGIVHIGSYTRCIPGKFYDLLGQGMPMLFLCEEGHELSAILDQLGMGVARGSRRPQGC